MSEQKRFDVPEVLAALEAAVEKRGEDYVYEQPLNRSGMPMGCLYVHDRDTENETPGCIVGQVYFDLLGERVPGALEVGLTDGEGGSKPNDEWVRRGPFTVDALRVLAPAQIRQDDGETWGDALAAAKWAAGV